MKSKQPFKYKTVAIAGTFDRLHKGHRFFISEAFRLGERVMIGMTSDEFASKKLRTQNLEPRTEGDKDTSGVARRDSRPKGGGIRIKVNNYQTRKRELVDYLKREKLLKRAEIVKIEDVYGPAIRRAGRRENEIEALVVTLETYDGGLTVNRKREELGLFPLKLLKLPMILAEDKKKIASTRIRMGEIDRWGKAFSKIFNFQFSIFKITDELRQELKKPMGKLIRGNPNDLKVAAEELKNAIVTINPVLISTVGDEVTKLCNEVGIAINLAIVDFRVHREEKYHSLGELAFKPTFARAALANGVGMVRNPAGHITRELADAVKNAYLGIIDDGKQRIIQVDGEEDLAGVPAVLLAPLGSIVLYGQPDVGVVMVEVTEEKKQELVRLLRLYSSSKSRTYAVRAWSTLQGLPLRG